MALTNNRVWSILGIPATTDKSAIRRAYSVKLKQTHPEDDPEGFQALRAAYERALSLADGSQTREQPEEAWTAPSARDHTRHAPAQGAVEVEEAHEQQTPPGVGAEEIQALEQAFGRLNTLIETEPSNPTEIIASFEAAMRLSALQAVTIRQQAEHWIASMILRNAPRADMLIDPAIETFGWTRTDAAISGTIAEAVVARRAAVDLSRRGSPHYKALQALAKPPSGLRLWRNWLTPGLGGEVRRLLNHPDLGALEDQVDRRAYAWWMRRLSHRHHWIEWTIWMLFGFGVLRNLMTFWTASLNGWAIVPLILVLTGAFGAWLACGRARELVIGHRPWMIDRLQALWLAPALASLLLGALAPASHMAELAIAVLGLLALVTASAFAAPGQGDAWVINFRARPSVSVSPAAGVLYIIGIPMFLYFCLTRVEYEPSWPTIRAFDQAGLAVFGVTLAFAVAFQNLRQTWFELHAARPRIAILAGLVLLTAATPFLLWATAPNALLAGPGYVWVSVMSLVHLVLWPTEQGHKVRNAIAFFGWIAMAGVAAVAEEFGQGNATLLFGGIWILSMCAAGLIGAFREEVLLAAQRRRASSNG